MIRHLVDPGHRIDPVVEMVVGAVLLLAFAGFLGSQGFELVQGMRLPFGRMTLFFTGFVIVHACYLLGWRRGLAFFLATAGIGLVFEYVGVRTGVVFGRYAYTGVLGWKLLGEVAWPIPLAYFMVLYPATLMANLLLQGTPVTARLPWAWSACAALLAGLIMSAWDLTMDPYMVGQQHAWVWLDGGPYFGIPFRNFGGWVLTTFAAGMAYRLIEHRIPLRPHGRVNRWIVSLPITCYAVLFVGDLYLGFPAATRVIAPFTMAIAWLAAMMRLLEPVLGGAPDPAAGS
jgi:putative membrane protein